MTNDTIEKSREYPTDQDLIDIYATHEFFQMAERISGKSSWWNLMPKHISGKS